MAASKLYEDDVSLGDNTGEITVIPCSVVSVSASKPVRIFAKNGDDGGLLALADTQPVVDNSRRHNPQYVHFVSFIAPSDTIQIQPIHEQSHVAVYGSA